MPSKMAELGDSKDLYGFCAEVGKNDELSPKQRAVSYLDDAVDVFLSKLESQGYLDNTLVILTTDESGGPQYNSVMLKRWILCFALAPSKFTEKLNPGIYGLVDLPTSIIDYLKIPVKPEHNIHGRSIFRQYDTPRFLRSATIIVSEDIGTNLLLIEQEKGGKYIYSSYHYDKSPLEVSPKADAENIELEHPLFDTIKPAFTAERYDFVKPDSTLSIPEAETKRVSLSALYMPLIKNLSYRLDVVVTADDDNVDAVQVAFPFSSIQNSNFALDMVSWPTLLPGDKLSFSCYLDIKANSSLYSFGFQAAARNRQKAVITVEKCSLTPINQREMGTTEILLYRDNRLTCYLDKYNITNSRGTLEYETAPSGIHGDQIRVFLPVNPDVRDFDLLCSKAADGVSKFVFGDGFLPAGVGFTSAANNAEIYFQIPEDNAEAPNDICFTVEKAHLNYYKQPIVANLYINDRYLDTVFYENAEPLHVSYRLSSSDLRAGWNRLNFHFANPMVAKFEDTSSKSNYLLGLSINASSFAVNPFVKREVPRIVSAGNLVHDGEKLMNSAAAVDLCLSKGANVIEIDFSYTSDGQLVCVGNWSDIGDKPLSYAEFVKLNNKISDGKRILDLKSLGKLMEKNDNLYVVTAIRERSMEALALIKNEIECYAERIIPQIYDLTEYDVVSEMGYKRIILSIDGWGNLKKINAKSNLLVNFLKKREIFALSGTVNTISKNSAFKPIMQLGVPVYARTVNDANILEQQKKLGISEIFTDLLYPEDENFWKP